MCALPVPSSFGGDGSAPFLLIGRPRFFFMRVREKYKKIIDLEVSSVPSLQG